MTPRRSDTWNAQRQLGPTLGYAASRETSTEEIPELYAILQERMPLHSSHMVHVQSWCKPQEQRWRSSAGGTQQ